MWWDMREIGYFKGLLVTMEDDWVTVIRYVIEYLTLEDRRQVIDNSTSHIKS